MHTRLKRKSLSLGFDASRTEINHHATIVLAHAIRALSRDTVSLSFPRNPIFPFINADTSFNGVPRKRFSIIMENCVIYSAIRNLILRIHNVKKLTHV